MAVVPNKTASFNKYIVATHQERMVPASVIGQDASPFPVLCRVVLFFGVPL